MLGKRDRDRWKQAEALSEQWRQKLNLRDEDISEIKQELYAKYQIKKPSIPLIAIGLPTATAIALAISLVIASSENQQVPPSEQTLISQYHLPNGEYTFATSASWIPVICDGQGINNYIQTVQQQNSINFQLTQQSPGGSVGAIRALTNEPNVYAFAVSSDELLDEQRAAAQENGLQLKEIPVARDAVAFVAHPDLEEIDALTQEQIRQIYTGENGQRVTWTNLGFDNVIADLETNPISRNPNDSGTARYFFRWIGINSPSFGTVIQEVPYVGTSGEEDGGLAQTLNNPGSIFYATATEIFGNPNLHSIAINYDGEAVFPYTSPGFYPLKDCANPTENSNPAIPNLDYDRDGLVRPIYVVVKDYLEDTSISPDEQNHEQVGSAYACMLLTDEGQKLLQKIGYFPLSSEIRTEAIRNADCDRFRQDT